MQSPSPFNVAGDAAMRRALVVGVVVSAVAGLLVLVVLAVVVNVAIGLLVCVAVMVAGAAAWVTHVQHGFAEAMEAVVGDLGHPVSDVEQPAMRNSLDGVAILTGVRSPELRVLELDSANAMVVSDGEESIVVVTSGLLERCRTVESEVIAAELLCRVRDGSARYGTLAAGLTPMLRRVAGIDEVSVADLLGEQRAVRTDADAVAVTRYPPGLVSAFERMAEVGTCVENAVPATAPLWIAPAVGVADGVAASVDSAVNQPLDYRIAVLREL
jgi:heat shock protein HtpX